MHELSIAEALVAAVGQELVAHPGAQVRSVTVRIGALRQVQPATLTLCFAAATQDTRLAGVRLAIEPVAARARCEDCRTEFPVEDQWFTCPHCQATHAQMLAGDELQLTGIELEQLAA